MESLRGDLRIDPHELIAIRSVVGTIDLDGYKVEGVHTSVDTGVMDFLFVCDQDDPATSSPLLSASMPLDAGPEREAEAS